MFKAQVLAQQKNAHVSPKKVAPVLDLVRGKKLQDAKLVLTFDPTKAASLVLKVLKSAEANAKHNENLSSAKLYISDLQVNGGQVVKRGRIVGKSKYHPILKRTSHIIVGLSELE